MFDNKYRRQSQRATWIDYNRGVFFITICEANRRHAFGEVQPADNDVDAASVHHDEETDANATFDACTILSPLGLYLKLQLDQFTQHYADARILYYVIMPDHVHIIMHLTHDEPKSSDHISATVVSPSYTYDQRKTAHARNNKGWLAHVVGNMKSYVTKHARTINVPFEWQHGFYDTWVRDERAYDEIRSYIAHNPIRWLAKHQ